MVQMGLFEMLEKMRENSGGDCEAAGSVMRFKTMAERSAWASSWVNENREMLTNKIKQYHKPSPSFVLTSMDFEDFLGDAIVILTEATIKAERKNTPWYGVFWFDFTKMLTGSQELHYRVPYGDIENELPGTLVGAPDAESVMLEYSDRVKQEEIEEFALRSAVPFMSPRERMAYDLVVGGAFEGRPMSSDKAGQVMGIDGADVRKMLRNVQTKVQGAGRLYFGDGRVMLFAMPWKPKCGTGKSPRRSRSGRENMARVMA